MLNPLYRYFVEPAIGKKEIEKIEIRLIFGRFPRLEHMEKKFDTGESWALLKGKQRFWVRFHPPRHAKPFWIAAFNRRGERVDYYCEARGAADSKKILEIPHPICYPLDQLLLMNYFARRRGILMHAAGVVHRGKAYLLAGASGAGKSTLSELLVKAKIGKMLSDERTIVREIMGKMIAFGTPWAGTAGIGRSGSAPLAGIFFLKHGRANAIEKLDPATAADRLLPVISIPWYDPDTAAPIIAFAKRLVAEMPAYEMNFTPNPSAIDFFRKYITRPF